MIGIVKILDFIKNNYKTIIVLALVAFFMLWLNECKRNKELKNEIQAEQKRTEQNIAALTGQIEKYINSKGDTSYQKPIAQMSLEEIKKNLPLLYDAIKAESGKVTQIITERIYYRDTGSTTSVLSQLNKDTYSIGFDYKSQDSVLTIKGHSMFEAKTFLKDSNRVELKINPMKTYFDESKIQFGLTTGIKTDKDGLQKIFVTPSSDKIKITDIQGADLTDFFKDYNKQFKDKRFSIGPYIGYSVTFGANNSFYHGPSVGIGITYSIIKF